MRIICKCLGFPVDSLGARGAYPPGPVRAVAFHPSRALLATGGDDYKIKVWGAYCSNLSFLAPHSSKTSGLQIAAASSPSMVTLTTFGPFSSIMRCLGL